MIDRRSRHSEEFVTVTWSADVDLDEQAVEIAVTRGEPTDSDWHAAAWVGPIGKERNAQIAPSVLPTLTPGTWVISSRLTDNPERPYFVTGYLEIR